MLRTQIAGPLTLQQSDFVQTIIANVDRMRILGSDLQEVSRIETRHLTLDIQQTPLRDALRNALQATQARIEGRSQTNT